MFRIFVSHVKLVSDILTGARPPFLSSRPAVMLITVSTKYSHPGVPVTNAILAVRHSNASKKSNLSGEEIRQLKLRRRGVGWGLLPATWGREIFLEAGTGSTGLTGGDSAFLGSDGLGLLLGNKLALVEVFL